jgi:hypothetical protein
MTAGIKRKYPVLMSATTEELYNYLKILNTRDNFLPLKRCTDLEKGKE